MSTAPHPYDASILARIMRNEHVNGEVGEMTPQFAAMARTLINAEPMERPEMFRWLLAEAFGEDSQKFLAVRDAVVCVNEDHPVPEPPARVEEAATISTPAESRSAFLATFSNFRVVREGDKDHRVPVTMADIGDSLREVAGDWPKRIGNTLFVEGQDHKPRYLKSSPSLFAWLDRRAFVQWTKGTSFVSQERFFEDRRAEAEGFEAIEHAPHFPPVDGVYYMHHPVPSGDGRALEGMVDFFNPATPEDRSLILAMVLTWFWGGPPGTRPAFVIEGPEGDREMGRGGGKTTLGQALAEELSGGFIDISANDHDADQIKTRLLSNDAGRKRVAIIDNLKTSRFSSSGIEGIITSRSLSGRALYEGEASRPNLLNMVITVNGGHMSKDMAKRSVMIRLGRPVHQAGWEQELRSYIRANYWSLLGDIRDVLSSGSTLTTASTRWADWEHDVLGKLPNADVLQKLVVERQKASDVDDDERGLIIDMFNERIAGRSLNPLKTKVFMPNALVADWVVEATRQSRNTTQVRGFLMGLAITNLTADRRNSARGWYWTGDDCVITDPRDVEVLDAPPRTLGSR